MAIILYGHGGSRNHGCEAIVRSTIGMLGNDIVTYSSDVKGDLRYGLDKITTLVPMHSTKESLIANIYCGLVRRAFKDYGPLIKFQYKDMLSYSDQVLVSVGGDNYCNAHPYSYMEANKLLSKHNKTVLWGCSVTPSLLNNKKILDDMNRYTLIVARESLTFNALKEAGVTSKLYLLPDPAFTLDAVQTELPEKFQKENTIGINLSPLVEEASGSDSVLRSSIEKLIDYILHETKYQIALIPHVVWKKSDDLVTLNAIYNKYRDQERVFVVDASKNLGCRELKYIISQCSLMVVARTHASIAAYSTCVPTMVLGYSVKSRGIAMDLFGTEKNYVVPVQGLTDTETVLNSFKWIMIHRDEIHDHLNKIMPEYIARSRSAGKLLKEMEMAQ